MEGLRYFVKLFQRALSGRVTNGILCAIAWLGAASVVTGQSPYLYDVDAYVREEGWNGLSDPNHVWVNRTFTTSLADGSPPVSGMILLPSLPPERPPAVAPGSWSLSYEFSSGTNEIASGVSAGDIVSPFSVAILNATTAQWRSQFKIQYSSSSVYVTVWARDQRPGVHAARVKSGARIAQDNLNYWILVHRIDGASMPTSFTEDVQLLVEPDLSATATRLVNGITYRRLKFRVPGTTTWQTRLRFLTRAYASQSCIIRCPGSRVIGGGFQTSTLLMGPELQGTPLQDLSFVSSNDVSNLRPGDQVTLTVSNARGPQASYAWFVNEIPVGWGPSVLQFLASEPGTWTIRADAFNEAGYIGSGAINVRIQGCGQTDFNNNGVFPEQQDVIDFFAVLAGATPLSCHVVQGCDSIDFNNNGSFPEDQDVIDFFHVLAGGSCP